MNNTALRAEAQSAVNQRSAHYASSSALYMKNYPVRNIKAIKVDHTSIKRIKIMINALKI